MLLPLHDHNPRRRFPIFTALGTAFVAAITTANLLEVDLGVLSTFGYGSRGALDPLLANTFSELGFLERLGLAFFTIWIVLHLWTFADNVEDHLGAPLFAPAFLALGLIGWGVAGGGDAASIGGFPQAVSAAAVVCYAILYPRQEVIYFVLRPVHRGFDFPGLSAQPIHVAVIGFFGIQAIAWATLSVPLVPVILGAILGFAVAAASIALVGRPAHFPLVDDDLFGDTITLRSESEVTVEVQRTPIAEPDHGPTATIAEPLPDRVTDHPLREAPALLWGVVRTSDGVDRFERLARIVRAHTHEAVFDITRRLHLVRGVLAVDLLEGAARDLADALRGAGFDAIATPWPQPPLARAIEIEAVAWSPTSIALQGGVGSGGESQTYDIPWRRIRIAAGTRLRREARVLPNSTLTSGQFSSAFSARQRAQREAAQREAALFGASGPTSTARSTTRIDLLVEPNLDPQFGAFTPPQRFAIFEKRTRVAIDRPTGGFRECARALLSHRGVLAVNEGIEKIAEDSALAGRWGYLEFRSTRTATLYLAWLAALSHPARRSGTPLGSEAAASGDGHVSFLE